jgi:hypothetical protein
MKKILAIVGVLGLMAALAVPMAALAADKTTEVSGNVTAALELTAPANITLGAMVIGVNTGTSATDGSVKCNSDYGYAVTVESDKTDGKMTSATPNTLTNALVVTTGSLSGVVVKDTPVQTCVDTSAPGETAIALSVSQTIVYTDAADTGYSLTLTYTATAKTS